MDSKQSAFGRVPEAGPGLTVEEFLARFYDRGRPVVVRGGAADWPALERWTWNYLGERFSESCDHQGAQLRKGTQSRDYREGRPVPSPEIPSIEIVDFLRRLEAGETSAKDYYLPMVFLGALEGKPVGRRAPVGRTLAEDLRLPRWMGSLHRGPYGWFGPADHYEFNHFDADDNFLCAVKGRKRVRLLAPSNLPFLYADPHHGYAIQSPVDLESPDLERFPESEKLEVYEVTLEPGDVLYIPVFWWHQVSSLTTSASVNFFCSGMNREGRYWERLSSAENLAALEHHLFVNHRSYRRDRTMVVFGKRMNRIPSEDELLDACLRVLEVYPKGSMPRDSIDRSCLMEFCRGWLSSETPARDLFATLP
ncbi:MAG: cupin-like domain-containing protein [Candidatus Binatia bacterium]|nr:cupin-like domain-containing protein [Candidatus Binatia bacterium]